MSTNTTLWKDTVLLEVNKAVLYSYQKSGVTTWDHHTASESFMQFYNSEMKTRGGCPADWIWLVPPMSSCTSPLFHQEMALYFLKPSFEYQVFLICTTLSVFHDFKGKFRLMAFSHQHGKFRVKRIKSSL